MNFEKLSSKYGFKPKGVIHIGAHLMEERKEYLAIGVQDIIWIEANPKIYERIKQENTSERELFFNCAISDKSDVEIEFNITNNNQSSSILELDKHKLYHPEIYVTEKISVMSKTIDDLFESENIDAANYNLLNIDIQGAEYLAFLGATKTLEKIDFIHSEVNAGKLYKDCGLISDIDELLSRYGFSRVETDMSPWEWGDAFYIKNK